MGSMARGRLRLSLRLSPRPRLILTSFMEDLDMDTLDTPDTSDTMAMDSDTCTARGPLMLRLSLIPTFFMEDTLDMDTSDMPDSDTMDTDTADTSTANRLHQDISVNHRLNLGQKWIIISL